MRRRHIKKKILPKAEELFKQNSIEYPEDGKIHYNLANTHYKNEKYDEAIAEYKASLKNEGVNKAKVLYNIGDSYFKIRIIRKQLNIIVIRSLKTRKMLIQNIIMN